MNCSSCEAASLPDGQHNKDLICQICKQSAADKRVSVLAVLDKEIEKHMDLLNALDKRKLPTMWLTKAKQVAVLKNLRDEIECEEVMK